MPLIFFGCQNIPVVDFLKQTSDYVLDFKGTFLSERIHSEKDMYSGNNRFEHKH